VQAAHSGHPGTPMAMAPAAYCLWHRVLRFDPDAAQKEMLHLIRVCYPAELRGESAFGARKLHIE
jgi:hypothetical protein